MTLDLIKAVFLGIVEGLTEFIPVSSTGHLLLVGHFFGFDDESFGKSFDVLIQLGAILALLSIYFSRLWRLFLGMFSNRDDQRFVIGVLIAFLPAMVIGALAYGTIKSVLFNVWIVCTMLVVGGFVLLWIDRLNLKPRYHDATKFSLPMYLGIGAIQCLSMVPGVSRAGATIVGAMLFGADKRAATEFSFWLANPHRPFRRIDLAWPRARGKPAVVSRGQIAVRDPHRIILGKEDFPRQCGDVSLFGERASRKRRFDQYSGTKDSREDRPTGHAEIVRFESGAVAARGRRNYLE